MMGKITDSLLSGSSGRTCRLVVANVSGTEILRARPRKRSGEASPKQALVQNRMRKCYDFISSYKSYAKKYFGKRIEMRSPYNQAMTNLLEAFKLDYVLNTIIPVFAEIEFARGNLLAAIPTALTAPVAGSFTVDWFDNSGGLPVRETDQLQLLYCAENEKKSVFLENSGERNDLTLSVPVAPNLQGKTLHVWIAFRSLDLEETSASAYVGSVVLP